MRLRLLVSRIQNGFPIFFYRFILKSMDHIYCMIKTATVANIFVRIKSIFRSLDAGLLMPVILAKLSGIF